MKSNRERLTAQLRSLPGIEEIVSQKYPDFVSFEFNSKAIAHFDTDTEFDLKLGKARIASEGLAHPRDSTNHPNRYKSNPHWIVLPVASTKDVNEILRLVGMITEAA